MLIADIVGLGSFATSFNEAAGAYPADAHGCALRDECPVSIGFNEAAGAYPADAPLSKWISVWQNGQLQ